MNEILLVKSKGSIELPNDYVERELFDIKNFDIHGYKVFSYSRSNIPYKNVKNVAVLDNSFYFYKGIVTTDNEDEISLNVEEFTHYYDKTPQELEGFYSLIKIDEEKLIHFKNGTNVFLTWVYEDENYFCISTDFNVITEYLQEKLKIKLEYNDIFFGNLSSYLQNMTYCGGPYKNLKNIDSFYYTEYNNSKDELSLNMFDNLYDKDLEDLYKVDKKLFWDRISYSSQFTLKKIFKALYKEDISSQITGGRDSRLNLAYLINLFKKENITLKTRGKDWNNDLILGKEISNILGIEHQTMPLADFSYQKLDYIDLLKTYKNSGFMRTFAVGFSIHDYTKQNYRHLIELNGLLGNVVTGDKSGLGKYAVPFSDAVDPQMLKKLKQRKISIIDEIEKTINIKDKYQYYFIINFNKHNTTTFDLNSKTMFPISIFALDILSRAAVIIPYKNNGEGELHYELMSRLEKDLVELLPFENSKSFSNFNSNEIEKVGMDYTIAMPNGKFLFLDLNKEKILKKLSNVDSEVINKSLLENMKKRDFTPNDKRVILSWLGYSISTGKMESDFGILELDDSNFDDVQNKEIIDAYIDDNKMYFDNLETVNFGNDIKFTINNYGNINNIQIKGAETGVITPEIVNEGNIAEVKFKSEHTEKITILLNVGIEKYKKQKQIFNIKEKLAFQKYLELGEPKIIEEKFVNFKIGDKYNYDFVSSIFYQTFLFRGLKPIIFNSIAYIIVNKKVFRDSNYSNNDINIEVASCNGYYILKLSNYILGKNTLNIIYKGISYKMYFEYKER